MEDTKRQKVQDNEDKNTVNITEEKKDIYILGIRPTVPLSEARRILLDYDVDIILEKQLDGDLDFFEVNASEEVLDEISMDYGIFQFYQPKSSFVFISA